MKNQCSFCLSVILALVVLMSIGQPVSADGIVGMSSPDAVQRGNSFLLEITATGASAGVNGVQLYLQYDASSFSFVKANSSLLGTPGTEISEGKELKTRTLSDDVQGSRGIVTILAFGDTVAPGDHVVARLEFLCKVDAHIGPGSFRFDGSNNFVSVNGVKIPATGDALTLQVGDPNVASQGQPEPQPPEPTPENPTESSLNVPFDPNNQLGPADGVDPNQNPAAYGIGRLSEETTPVSTTSPTAPPTTAYTTKAAPTTEASKESPLKTVAGETLTVPESGLPLDQIPSGFQGDTEEIQGVRVPFAKGRIEDREIKLYYLQAGGSPSYYSYDPAISRFLLFDMAKLNPEASDPAQNVFQASRKSKNSWKILLVSLLGISSLSIMIYSLTKNLKR